MDSFCQKNVVLGYTQCNSALKPMDLSHNIAMFLLHLDLKYRMAPFENKHVEIITTFKGQKTVESSKVPTNERRIEINGQVYWIDRQPDYSSSNRCPFDPHSSSGLLVDIVCMYVFHITKEGSDEKLIMSSSYIHNAIVHQHFDEKILPSRLMTFFRLSLDRPYEFDHKVISILTPESSFYSSTGVSVKQLYQRYSVRNPKYNIDNVEPMVSTDQYDCYIDKSLGQFIYIFHKDCLIKHDDVFYIEGQKGHLLTFKCEGNKSYKELTP